jgi:hypothetical protein
VATQAPDWGTYSAEPWGRTLGARKNVSEADCEGSLAPRLMGSQTTLETILMST